MARRLPSFGTYLRVMRHQPAFWLKLLPATAFGLSLLLTSGPGALGVALGIAAVVLLILFPFWRRLALRRPERYTFGNTHLLDQDG